MTLEFGVKNVGSVQQIDAKTQSWTVKLSEGAV